MKTLLGLILFSVSASAQNFAPPFLLATRPQPDEQECPFVAPVVVCENLSECPAAIMSCQASVAATYNPSVEAYCDSWNLENSFHATALEFCETIVDPGLKAVCISDANGDHMAALARLYIGFNAVKNAYEAALEACCECPPSSKEDAPTNEVRLLDRRVPGRWRPARIRHRHARHPGRR